MMKNKIAAVILAAGEGKRFRAASGTQALATKLIADYKGKPLVRHVVDAALAAGLAPVIVVTGHAADDVKRTLVNCPVRYVQNNDYASGMGSSLRLGFAALDGQTGGAMVLLGDMPLVDAALISEMTRVFADDVSAIVPVFEGERGNPVLLSMRLAPEIAVLTGDAGARYLLRGREDVREIVVSTPAARLDIDTPDALKNL